MGKRKRSKSEEYHRNFFQSERWYQTNLGLPEVDGILHHLRFKLRSIAKNTVELSSSIKSLKKEFLRFKLGRHGDNIKSHPKKDVISRLPDEILKFIISSLSTREGAATCILARRWRSLWTKSVSHLDFDIPTMIGHNYHKNMFRDNGRGNKRSHHLLKEKSDEFTQWVDRVLHLRSAATRLDSLRVCFVLDEEYASCIDRWIKSAVAQGVTDIELDFSIFRFECLPPKDGCSLYEFPTREDAPSLKHLRLRFLEFNLPRDFTGFASLISLSLDFIDISQHIVDKILSNCPLLECLSLVNCCYYDTTSLTFSGPSLLLKHLHIANGFELEKIEVHDINLISFELVGALNFPKFSLKNAPHLARLVLLGCMHIETLSDVPHLEILFLKQHYAENDDRPGLNFQSPSLPPSCVFNNLQRLVFVNEDVETSFLEVLRLLKTFPSLQELEVNMCPLPTWDQELSETMRKLTAIPQLHHNNLQEVEIYGFEASCERIAFAKYLLKYANALEKMKITTTRKVYKGNGSWTLHEGFDKEKSEEHLKKVHMQLQKVVPSSTKLEISSILYNFETMQ